MADLDFSSVWSWTVPLWGLFVLVLFLGGVLADPPTLMGGAPVQLGGGAISRTKTARKQ
jgi:hypothetical protein